MILTPLEKVIAKVIAKHKNEAILSMDTIKFIVEYSAAAYYKNGLKSNFLQEIKKTISLASKMKNKKEIEDAMTKGPGAKLFSRIGSELKLELKRIIDGDKKAEEKARKALK